MALLTAEQVRGHIQTDLDDAALGLLLADAEAEIVLRCGSATARTDTLRGESSDWIYPSIAIAAASDVTRVVERRARHVGDDTLVTLADDDWSLWHGGTALFREPQGANPPWRRGWAYLVTLEYRPAGGAGEEARRKRAQLDLVRLAIQHPGIAQQTSGGYSASYRDYERERSRILRRLKHANRRPLA